MIETRDLKIGYKDVLLNLNQLKLENGRVYALVGKNGAGKSTLLNTLAGQRKALFGDFLLNNRSISAIAANELPFEVALSGTRFTDLDFVSVFDYVSLGRSPHTNAFGILRTADRDQINKSIEQAHIEHLVHRHVADLSDGEKQLVNYARILAQDTPTLLLDEPTAFLDYQNKLLLLNSLVKVAQEERKCVLLSSHDIDLLMEFKLPLLLIDSGNKEVSLIAGEISKEEIIQRAFN